jgi:hypothetical protein
MPQASEELRKLWGGSDGVGEDKAEKFLKSHGYKLRRDWRWELPTSNHSITDDEFDALCFLVDEWDYGGIYKEGKE